MFEKEAEEIANKICGIKICYNLCNFNSPKHHRCGVWHRCYESAKDGAEFGYNKALNNQLTKAKEIIKEYMTIVKGSHSTVCGVPEEKRTINVLKLNKEAEQFLKEND